MHVDDARLHRIIDRTLVALAVPAGLAFGFVVFGSALWANIVADGAVDPTAIEILGEILPGVFFLGAPAVACSVIAWRRQLSSARLVVAASAVLPMTMFTSYYGLAALAVAAAVSSAVRSWTRRRWAFPAADATALVAGLSLISLWCVLEAGR